MLKLQKKINNKFVNKKKKRRSSWITFQANKAASNKYKSETIIELTFIEI